mmetsp:Transcript_89204/g.239024  ORF Transcript_89204/g.239024 Transcript_89204/m.239024 type:complete len:214 (-) Transcript_89204:311-952(-)
MVTNMGDWAFSRSIQSNACSKVFSSRAPQDDSLFFCCHSPDAVVLSKNFWIPSCCQSRSSFSKPSRPEANSAVRYPAVLKSLGTDMPRKVWEIWLKMDPWVLVYPPVTMVRIPRSVEGKVAYTRGKVTAWACRLARTGARVAFTTPSGVNTLRAPTPSWRNKNTLGFVPRKLARNASKWGSSSTNPPYSIDPSPPPTALSSPLGKTSKYCSGC